MEEDTLRAQRGGYSRHANPEALYTTDDVEPVLKALKPIPRSGPFDISPEFHFVAYDAGHILGSTSLELTITEGAKKTVVVFSGDIGRYDQPILNDPQTPPSKADALICESTYGDREHEAGDPRKSWRDRESRGEARRVHYYSGVCDWADAAFMYYLRQLEDQQRIPKVPVYVDSPMALSATDLYLKYKEDHDLDFTKEDAGGKGDPLNVHEFH